MTLRGLNLTFPNLLCPAHVVGRYLPSQQYYQHFDAFNLDEEDGRRFAANGGQRTVTVLIYLNNVERGGETSFPTLQLQVKPVQGEFCESEANVLCSIALSDLICSIF